MLLLSTVRKLLLCLDDLIRFHNSWLGLMFGTSSLAESLFTDFLDDLVSQRASSDSSRGRVLIERCRLIWVRKHLWSD